MWNCSTHDSDVVLWSPVVMSCKIGLYQPVENWVSTPHQMCIVQFSWDIPFGNMICLTRQGNFGDHAARYVGYRGYIQTSGRFKFYWETGTSRPNQVQNLDWSIILSWHKWWTWIKSKHIHLTMLSFTHWTSSREQSTISCFLHCMCFTTKTLPMISFSFDLMCVPTRVSTCLGGKRLMDAPKRKYTQMHSQPLECLHWCCKSCRTGLL